MGLGNFSGGRGLQTFLPSQGRALATFRVEKMQLDGLIDANLTIFYSPIRSMGYMRRGRKLPAVLEIQRMEEEEKKEERVLQDLE